MTVFRGASVNRLFVCCLMACAAVTGAAAQESAASAPVKPIKPWNHRSSHVRVVMPPIDKDGNATKIPVVVHPAPGTAIPIKPESANFPVSVTGTVGIDPSTAEPFDVTISESSFDPLIKELKAIIGPSSSPPPPIQAELTMAPGTITFDHKLTFDPPQLRLATDTIKLEGSTLKLDASQAAIPIHLSVEHSPLRLADPLHLTADSIRLALDAGERRTATAPKMIELNDDVRLIYPEGTTLNFAILSLPDPRIPRHKRAFDLGIQSLSRAFSDRGFTLDRFNLPWLQSEANSDECNKNQHCLGMTVYRKDLWRVDSVKQPGELIDAWIVYVVTERTTLGIDQMALNHAHYLATIGLGADASSGAEIGDSCDGRHCIPLLGPAFSGSMSSIFLALSDKQRPCRQRELEPGLKEKCEILKNGSDGFFAPIAISSYAASASTNDRLRGAFAAIGNPGVRLESSLAVDDGIRLKSLKRILQRLGRLANGEEGRRNIALFAETSDYGAAAKGNFKEIFGDDVVVRRFPPNFSQLRRELESIQLGQGAKISGKLPTLPRNSLELDTGTDDLGTEMPPDFSPQAGARVRELEFEQSLRNLKQVLKPDATVVLAATEVRDRLFLARRLRNELPGALLVDMEADMLLTHADYIDATRGMLVLSSADISEDEENSFATDDAALLYQLVHRMVPDPSLDNKPSSESACVRGKQLSTLGKNTPTAYIVTRTRLSRLCYEDDAQLAQDLSPAGSDDQDTMATHWSEGTDGAPIRGMVMLIAVVLMLGPLAAIASVRAYCARAFKRTLKKLELWYPGHVQRFMNNEKALKPERRWGMEVSMRVFKAWTIQIKRLTRYLYLPALLLLTYAAIVHVLPALREGVDPWIPLASGALLLCWVASGTDYMLKKSPWPFIPDDSERPPSKMLVAIGFLGIASVSWLLTRNPLSSPSAIHTWFAAGASLQVLWTTMLAALLAYAAARQLLRVKHGLAVIELYLKPATGNYGSWSNFIGASKGTLDSMNRIGTPFDVPRTPLPRCPPGYRNERGEPETWNERATALTNRLNANQMLLWDDSLTNRMALRLITAAEISRLRQLCISVLALGLFGVFSAYAFPLGAINALLTINVMYVCLIALAIVWITIDLERTPLLAMLFGGTPNKVDWRSNFVTYLLLPIALACVAYWAANVPGVRQWTEQAANPVASWIQWPF